jgi:endonuclease/exonuclease/phosphatase family metal-dependent hydrolase
MPDSNTPISQRPAHAHTAHRKYGPRIYLSIGSAFVCVVLTLVYVLRPLGADPITIWPFWFWALPAIALSVFGISRRNLLCGIAATVMWIAVVAIVPEEPTMLLRSLVHPNLLNTRQHPSGPNSLRVITFNCAGGIAIAAAEAFQYNPDILLLQEAPPEAELRKLMEIWPKWQMSAALDPAILVRGQLTPVGVADEKQGFVCLATVTPECISPPTQILLLSTRFFLPELRMDFWRPETWRAAAGTQAIREEQMADIAAVVANGRPIPGMATILGGDFNTPAGDALFDHLRPTLRDAFAEAGTGWPNTIINSAPMARIDQVWVSEHFTVDSARVVKTINSDHRMVIVDLTLNPSAPQSTH